MATVVVLDKATRKETERIEIVGKDGTLAMIVAKPIAPGSYCRIECSSNRFFDVSLKVTSCRKEGDSYRIKFEYNFK